MACLRSHPGERDHILHISARSNREELLPDRLTMTRKNAFFNIDRLPEPTPGEDIAVLMKREMRGKDGKPHRPFETPKKARNEDRKRIKRLPKSKRKAAHDLAQRLEGALKAKQPCPTLASSWYMREFRRRITGLVLRLIGSDLAHHVTLVNIKWLIDSDQLLDLPPHRIMEQFRKQLRDVGVDKAEGLFIAYLHGEFLPKSKQFQLHFHCIATGEKKELLRELSAQMGYRKEAPIKVPKKFTLIRDPAIQCSYLWQSWWPNKLRDDDSVRHWDKSKWRIPGKHHTTYLLWLDRCRLKDVLIAYPPLSRLISKEIAIGE